MRRPLLIPLQYLLLLLLLTLIITLYALVVGSALYRNLGQTPEATLFFVNLIWGLKFSLYIGGTLATLILLRKILSFKAHRALALLLLFLVSGPLFFFGYYGIRNIETANVLGDSPEITDLRIDTIIEFHGGGLYFQDTSAGALREVVLFHYGNLLANPLDNEDSGVTISPIDDPGVRTLSYFEEVSYDSLRREIVIQQRSRFTPDGSALVVNDTAILNSRSALFGQTGILMNLQETIRRLFSTLDEYADELSVRYLALVLSLLFFLFSSWMFLRLTRWPMINFVMAVLVNAGGLLLTRVGDLFFVRELAMSFLQTRAIGYIGPALLGFFALLFLIFHAFLPRVRDWQREIER